MGQGVRNVVVQQALGSLWLSAIEVWLIPKCLEVIVLSNDLSVKKDRECAACNDRLNGMVLRSRKLTSDPVSATASVSTESM